MHHHLIESAVVHMESVNSPLIPDPQEYKQNTSQPNGKPHYIQYSEQSIFRQATPNDFIIIFPHTCKLDTDEIKDFYISIKPLLTFLYLFIDRTKGDGLDIFQWGEPEELNAIL